MTHLNVEVDPLGLVERKNAWYLVAGFLENQRAIASREFRAWNFSMNHALRLSFRSCYILGTVSGRVQIEFAKVHGHLPGRSRSVSSATLRGKIRASGE